MKEIRHKAINEQIDMSSCVPCIDELCESTHDYQQSVEKVTINANKLSQWGVYKEGIYYPSFSTVKKLEPGFYDIGSNHNIGHFLKKKEIYTDELIQLPSDELLDMINDIETFWKRADIFKEYKFVYKRGLLLYGLPGMGKSCIIQLCTKYLIEELGGIVINLYDSNSVELYHQMIGDIREVEPNRPLIVIMEDIDVIIGERNYGASLLLNILDGVKQIDNVVYIATTNYPEKLEERVTNRPSRFDKRYEIKPPSREVREKYFKTKLKPKDLETIELNRWLDQTEGMSLAHLKELIISVVAIGNEFDEAIARLKDLKTKPKIESRQKPSIGFNDSEKIYDKPLNGWSGING